MMQNYYEVLNCKSDATTAQLKKEYQALVRQYLPDRDNYETDLTHKDFQKAWDIMSVYKYHHLGTIKQAWAALRDSEIRKLYDQRWQDHLDNEAKGITDEILDEHFYCNEEEEPTVYKAKHDCGGFYILTEQDCDFDYDYVTCNKCSKTIKLLQVIGV